MSRRPSLLAFTAAGAALSMIVHGAVLTADLGGKAAPVEQTRLGASIQQSMAERDRAMAEKQRALDLREQAMRAAELRYQAAANARKATAPGPAQAGGASASPVTATATQANEQADEQYEDLARIYQAMKPAKAALVFERLELDLQVRVTRRMRERSTAMILAAMSPEGAARLTMALANRRPSPPATPVKVADSGTAASDKRTPAAK